MQQRLISFNQRPVNTFLTIQKNERRQKNAVLRYCNCLE